MSYRVPMRDGMIIQQIDGRLGGFYDYMAQEYWRVATERKEFVSDIETAQSIAIYNHDVSKMGNAVSLAMNYIERRHANGTHLINDALKKGARKEVKDPKTAAQNLIAIARTRGKDNEMAKNNFSFLEETITKGKWPREEYQMENNLMRKLAALRSLRNIEKENSDLANDLMKDVLTYKRDNGVFRNKAGTIEEKIYATWRERETTAYAVSTLFGVFGSPMQNKIGDSIDYIVNEDWRTPQKELRDANAVFVAMKHVKREKSYEDLPDSMRRAVEKGITKDMPLRMGSLHRYNELKEFRDNLENPYRRF